MKPLRLGLVGLGNQGREHLTAALQCPDIQFVCGFDTQQSSVQKAQQLQPNLQCPTELS